MLRRHVVAVLALPFAVTVLIPAWIYAGTAMSAAWPSSARACLAFAAGLLVLPAGVALFASTLHRFATEGRGTLAPWDPPVHFVVSGPYRYVRNPMISGVMLILVAESLLLRSWPHAAWAVGFFAANLMHLPFVEEPALIGRFGAAYREYLKHVPRFIPRRTPWSAASPAASPVRPRVVAVIPAAGKSTRFGSDKRAAAVDGVPMLARVVSLMRDAGCDAVVVVHGPGGLPTALGQWPLAVENPVPERGMFSSIQAGLARVAGADVVLVHPGDMPFVSTSTVRAVAAACARAGRPVCPTFSGKRGHPLAIPAAVVPKLLALEASTPLNEALAIVGTAREVIDCADPGVVRDVDRPQDLRDPNGERIATDSP